MKNRKPRRIVLAFYPADEGPSNDARRSLQRIARVCTVRPGSTEIPASCRRYALLRLEGEAMVVTETQPSKVESAVSILQLSGSPAIFVVGPNFEVSPEFKGEPITASPDKSALTRSAILARLGKYRLALDSARHDLVQATRLEHALSPAAEWILDNTWLIHAQINEVQRHLPRDYSTWATGNGHGNIHSVAHDLVSNADYVVTDATIRECLKKAQAGSPFTIAELWAFPLFLRVALIEELTDLATRVNRGQQLRESAYLWANRLANSAREGAGVFEKMLHHLEAEPIARQPHFVTALAEQLQDEELALGPAQHWIEERFGKSLMEVVVEQHTREAAETVSTSNAFGSLRTLGTSRLQECFRRCQSGRGGVAERSPRAHIR